MQIKGICIRQGGKATNMYVVCIQDFTFVSNIYVRMAINEKPKLCGMKREKGRNCKNKCVWVRGRYLCIQKKGYKASAEGKAHDEKEQDQDE